MGSILRMALAGPVGAGYNVPLALPSEPRIVGQFPPDFLLLLRRTLEVRGTVCAQEELHPCFNRMMSWPCLPRLSVSASSSRALNSGSLEKQNSRAPAISW